MVELEHKVKEALRYMGYKKKDILDDSDTLNSTIKLMSELESFVRPKYTYKAFDITVDVENKTIGFPSFQVVSKNLSRNLKDCRRAVIFAATLSTQADLLIRRYAKSSITKSVIINACGSALIEQFCDDSQEAIQKEIGGYFRPRFSPGYGDFDLKHQSDITAVLESQKMIGLTLTDTLILMPEKSVTAVMGISSKFDDCPISGCEVCSKKDCEYRRS